MTVFKLFLLVFVFASRVFAQDEVFIVNGRGEQDSRTLEGRRAASEAAEAAETPFIVVAAAAENDAADPNEAFIPTNDDNGTNRPAFKLLTQEDLQREEQEDFEVIEAGVEESGRTFIPTNDNLSSQPGFKLLSSADLAKEASNEDVVVVEAGSGDEQPRLLDIPRDTSGSEEPFFKLPLPDEGSEEEEYDDVVIIAASDDEEGRSGFDNADSIPRDTSDFGSEAGFKLPLPDEGEEEYSDVEIIEADDEGRALSSDIPRDDSFFKGPGFKLPLPEEGEEEEYDDIEIIEADGEGRTLNSDIPRDTSRDDEAGPRLPKKIDDQVEIIEVGDDVDCFEDRDPGTCLNQHEAWFYDPTHNKCHFFIYSGCGGNSNRFFTEEECIGTCKDAKRSNKKKVVCPHGAPTCELGCVLGKDESDQGTCLTCICNKNQDSGKEKDVSRCLEPARTGLCKAALKYWYYNADRQECQEFTYGGCEAGSSPNKFPTKIQCQEACQGVVKE